MKYRKLKFLEVIEKGDEYLGRDDKWHKAPKYRIGEKWILLMPYRRKVNTK